MNQNQFLLIRLSHLGDIALTTGVIDYWHRTHGWTFNFITSQSMLPILLDHPAVASVISVAQTDKPFGPWLKFCCSMRTRYGHLPLIDLHGTLRSRILSAMWPHKVMRYPKMGLTRRIFHFTRNERCQQKLLQTNVPQRYSLAVEKKPLPKEELRPCIPVREQDHTWAIAQLAPLANTPLVALHPYATHPAKEWPQEHWLELIHRLQEHGIASIIIGQSDSPLSLRKIPKNTARPTGLCLDFTSKTDLAKTCALLANAHVLVSGDSGPMHLGTAVNTPVVALFGPTCQAWGFYPSGKHDTVLSSGASCSPCSLHGSKSCAKNFSCMRDISVGDVLTSILERVSLKKRYTQKITTG